MLETEKPSMTLAASGRGGASQEGGKDSLLTWVARRHRFLALAPEERRKKDAMGDDVIPVRSCCCSRGSDSALKYLAAALRDGNSLQ